MLFFQFPKQHGWDSEPVWEHLLYLAVPGNDVAGLAAHLEGAVDSLSEGKCIRDVHIFCVLPEHGAV